MVSTSLKARTRRDRCPGVLRPWPASDGALVRIRLVGGQLTLTSLRALTRVAESYGTGDVHLTGRANLQVRGLPLIDRSLPAEVTDALVATGLVPHPAHDLVRNILVSPQSGLAGGRCDLRPVAARLDEAICASAALTELPGRFLFALDDGRGDLADHAADLGVHALDASTVQLRFGSTGWGETVLLDRAPEHLVALARSFLDRRRHEAGDSQAAWHVEELGGDLSPRRPRDPRTRASTGPLPFGPVPGGIHLPAPEGVISPTLVARILQIAGTTSARTVVVTPWRGVLIPGVNA